MKKKGYSIVNYINDGNRWSTWHSTQDYKQFKYIASVSALNKDVIPPEKFIADCKECQVHTEVKSYYLNNSDEIKKLDTLYWHKCYAKDRSPW
jgi:hypothetical protein